MSSRSEDIAEGALLGLALGDALGFVVEAEPPEVARKYVTEDLRRHRGGRRAHPNFPFGQYSDDTQLARELLLSIVDAGDWDPASFARRVALLVRDGMDVGAGPGTRRAAMRLLLGAPWPAAGQPAPYAGNGAAMRVAPIGALAGWEVSRRLACAREQSRVTHHDRRCAAGAVAVAGAIVLGAQPGPLDAGPCLERLATWCEPDSAAMAALLREVGDWIRLDPSAARERLRGTGVDGDPGGPWRGISAFVLPSVAWSLYAFFRTPDDWWEVLCTAIEPGGDTDTMAAIAGGVAGARLGRAALPEGLLARLTDKGRWDARALAALARRAAVLDTQGRGVIVAEGGPPRSEQ
jgi:poly(ADP-ribose) glycohydrolase ARH3